MKHRVSVSFAIFSFLACAIPAQARVIPSYRMDSLVRYSTVVVYCKEENVQIRNIDRENWMDEEMTTKCKVLKSFKGGVTAGTVLTINYNSLFRRYSIDDGPYETVSAGVVSRHKAKYLPPGNSLLFLIRTSSESWYVLSAKLVINKNVLEFIQIANPGPLNLEPQPPENIQLAPGRKYGEQELLKDVAIAVKKAASSKEEIPQWVQGIRELE